MKVKELIEILSQFNQEKEIYCEDNYTGWEYDIKITLDKNGNYAIE